MIRLFAASVVCAVLATACGPTDSAIRSDDLVRELSDPSCPDCSITLDEVVSIIPGDEALPDLLNSRLSLDSRGRFYITPTHVQGVFTVYRSDGTFLREVGRFGEGPGELRYPQFVRGRSPDSLFVLDPSLARGLILDSSYNFIRSFQVNLRLVNDLVARTDDVLILPHPAFREGSALKVMDWGGNVIHSFGNPIDALGDAPFTASRDGVTWLARPDEYLVERYDQHGNFLSALQRRAPWFEPWQEGQIPREPQVRSISVDSTGILWVLVSVPVRGWREPPPRTAFDGHTLPIAPVDLDAGYDFVLEAIDPAEPEVLASTKISDGYVKELLDHRLLYTLSADAQGVVQYHVWRYTLVRR